MIRQKNAPFTLALLVQFALAVALIAMPAQAQTLAGYWAFNEGSGTTAADSSGSGNTATLINGVSWVGGQIGDAVSANGTNQYVNIPAVNLSSTNAVTLAAWVNRTYSTSGGHVLFEATANYNGSTTGFGVFPDDNSCGGIQAAVHGDVGYVANCYNQPSSGAWHHLAFVFDKSKAGANEVSFYVDGVLQTATRSLVTSTNTNNFGSNPLYVFSRGGTGEYASGQVDELRLYSSALTGGQIQQIYTATLASLAVTPANPTIGTGTPQQFTATGTYSDGSLQNLTNVVTWSSTSPGVATINSTGLATGVSAGSTTIQATSGANNGSTGLTVTAGASLVSIAVTPVNPSIAVGAPQQFTATGTYSDGTHQDLTSSATWTSTSPGVATINSTGLATGVSAGSTTIQAALGSINGSTTLTVTAGQVSGLAGYWALNEGSGTTSADSSGSGDTATLVNGVSWVSGKIGNAVSANGTNQYVSIPAVNLSSTNAVTLAAWVNRTYSTSGGPVLFEATANYNGSTTGFGVFPDDNSCGGLQAAVHGNVGYVANCYNQPSSGVWYHLAFVFDKSQAGANEVKFYLDGVLQTATRSLVTSTNTNNFGSNPIYVFSRGGTQSYAAGTVDELRLYSSALTAGQIQQIYTATLASLAVTPANPTIGTGTPQQFTATGTYSDGSLQNLTNFVTWSSTNPAVASINSTGLATGVSAGSTTIQAASGSINGSTGLTVTAGVSLVSIAVTPVNPSIAVGAPQQFTATGTYSDGSHQDLTNAATWTSTSPSVATINSTGLATGVSAGSTTIQATLGAINGSTTLTVTAGQVSGLAGYWAFNEGSGTTSADSSGSGNTATLVNGVSRVSGKIGNAVSANGTNQYVSIPAVNLSSTNAVTVTAWVNRTYSTSGGHVLFEATANYNGSTTGFGVFPDDNSCAGLQASLHGNVGYVANCYNQPSSGVWHHLAFVFDKSQTGANEVKLYLDGVLQTATRSLLTSTNTNNFGSNPLYVFSRGGTTEYASGQVDELRLYSSALTTGQIQQIYTATLASLAVTPVNPTIAAGTPQQFTATGTYSDGSLQNLTNVVTWSSTSPGVATINSTGLATGVSAGNTTIQAASGAINGSTGLTVTASLTLVSIAVAPVNPSIVVGTQEQFTATGTYSDGSHQDLTNAATWTSTSPSAATINSTGLATGVGVGTTTIRAALGSVNGSTTLTVTPSPTLVSIAVTPTNPTIAAGTPQQFTATGTYSDGSHQDLTNSATWSSTNPAVATINSTGLATGVSAGSTTIQATSGSINGTTGLTVTPPGGQFVQWTSGDAGSASVETTYLSQPVTTGNLIVVFSHWDNQTITATVTDNLGNTYNPISGPINVGAVGRFQAWYARNINGGTQLGVTITYSARTTSIALADAAEYSGLDPSAPLNVFASSTGTGVTQDSGPSAATNSANETIIGLFGYYGFATPYTAGPGFTLRNFDATSMLEDRSVNANGSYRATATSHVSTSWVAYVLCFKNAFQGPLAISVKPAKVTGGNPSLGTVTLNPPAPAGGATVTLVSSNPAVASVPASVGVPGGASSASFVISTAGVSFTTPVTITATYNSTPQSAVLTVAPATMSQVASDNFNRSNAPTLGANWTPLAGTSSNLALQVVGNQVQSTGLTPAIGKEMYYGGLTWAPDQYSEAQIVTASGNGYEGPAVRMTSNDTHYACIVFNTGTGNAAVEIILDNATTYTVLAGSTTATVRAGDVVRCTIQGTALTMTNQTTQVTLLSVNDNTILSGYPGLVDAAGTTSVTNYIMANWAAGDYVAPMTAVQTASDNFNRPDQLNLGSNWQIGIGHGAIQIVSGQIEPYPAGGPPPSKEHYIANGVFPNDQWSQIQIINEDVLGDNAVELRASDTADTLYVLDVNLTGGPGVAQTRIAAVINGIITPLVIDQVWSAVSPGDYIRGQVQGTLVSLVDVTTGVLLLSASDSNITAGYPGISMQVINGNPTDHIAANWSGGTFQ
ncbi:MAG TPA: Ig-like domain-containing protein [Terriglobales bacterium]